MSHLTQGPGGFDDFEDLDRVFWVHGEGQG